MIASFELNLRTQSKFELLDVTEKVEKLIRQSKIKEGICLVYAPHATAAIIINESADPAIKEDIINQLETLVPSDNGYLHDRIDNNAQAHIKSALLSSGSSIPVEKGRLGLGTWQAIFLAELDGPRSNRRVLIKVLGE